jgi:hypothetical protein
MPIAFGDLVGGLELLVVFVLDAERPADVVHSILIRSRIVSAGSLVADSVGVFPIGIDVSRRHDRARFRVLPARLFQLAAP